MANPERAGADVECVGIDLGTTHCAYARAPLESEGGRPEVGLVPQLVGRDRVERLPLLPSFLYFPHSTEGDMELPWARKVEHLVGSHARARASEVPGRVISSAKSWLSQSGVDRRAPMLPLQPAEDVEALSPVEATFRTLEHLAAAYRHESGRGALGDQQVVLTVPASFDAAARECTVEAAQAAGIDQLTLLEEPQAAFYAWLERKGDAFRSELSVGDVVLVVDVGGGTADFAAILLTEEDGRLVPRRIAVGQHILLGGDNMDLALAHGVKQKLEAQGKSLDAWQMLALTHATRAAKETLLGEDPPEKMPIVVPGRGSSLFGNTLRSELLREEVESTLVEGFFPRVDWQTPVKRRRSMGLRQRGLAYADDPALTAHLADFLRTHRGAVGASQEVAKEGAMLAPTHVLFNGGVFRSASLRGRLLETLNQWLSDTGAAPARELSSSDYDLAVARGACYFGLVKEGRGVRVRGGTARAYYVGIESPAPAVPGVEPPTIGLCVAPFGVEEGTSWQLPETELAVVVGEAVSFRFFSSTARREDEVGALIESPERELEELAPIAITLPRDGRTPGEWVAVKLEAKLTPVGVLELWARPVEARSEDEAWKVELSVRSEAPPS